MRAGSKKSDMTVKEILTLDSYQLVLFEDGVCSVYDKSSDKVFTVNKKESEKIVSVFKVPEELKIIIVWVNSQKETKFLKTRVLTLEDIEAKNFEGKRIFKQFKLRWPDFIEFDEINSKIITRHSNEGVFRIWDMASFGLCFVLRNDQIADFKICHGIMLVLYNGESKTIPMTVVDMTTGSPVVHFELRGITAEIELLEMFNEKLLIKLEDKPLKIFNVLTQEWANIENFDAPTAFIFLHDQHRFFTIDRSSVLSLWTVDGQLLKRFDDFTLCKAQRKEKDYVIEKSANNRFFIVNCEKDNKVVLQVIDLEKQDVIGQLNAKGSNSILGITKNLTAIQYDEKNHEIITGHSDGSLKFWSI